MAVRSTRPAPVNPTPTPYPGADSWVGKLGPVVMDLLRAAALLDSGRPMRREVRKHHEAFVETVLKEGKAHWRRTPVAESLTEVKRSGKVSTHITRLDDTVLPSLREALIAIVARYRDAKAGELPTLRAASVDAIRWNLLLHEIEPMPSIHVIEERFNKRTTDRLLEGPAEIADALIEDLGGPEEARPKSTHTRKVRKALDADISDIKKARRHLGFGVSPTALRRRLGERLHGRAAELPFMALDAGLRMMGFSAELRSKALSEARSRHYGDGPMAGVRASADSCPDEEPGLPDSSCWDDERDEYAAEAQELHELRIEEGSSPTPACATPASPSSGSIAGTPPTERARPASPASTPAEKSDRVVVDDGEVDQLDP